MNYYELEPSQNHFSDIMVDLTHKCNMACANCYIPNRNIPDLDVQKLYVMLRQLPRKTMIRLVGAEPTMRSDLVDIIKNIKLIGHRCTLLTNGLKLADLNYVSQLKESRLSHVYLSMNGVDNDDWYKAIDTMACASKKIEALKNLNSHRFILDTGTIIVKGINDEAPERLIQMYKRLGIKNVVCRLKNVGVLGRSIYDESSAKKLNLSKDENYSMDEIIQLVSSQLKISVDYIESWRHRPIYQNQDVEKHSFMFPLNPQARTQFVHKSGVWIKIADWDTLKNKDGVPLSDSHRRGRLTETFKIAPMSEHVKRNEFGY